MKKEFYKIVNKYNGIDIVDFKHERITFTVINYIIKLKYYYEEDEFEEQEILFQVNYCIPNEKQEALNMFEKGCIKIKNGQAPFPEWH